jgi:tetratricopeptide (TPR) repeat protein
MSFNLLTINPGCDLTRLERTNMVTKMEDRVKVDLVAMSKLILDHLRLCDPASLPHTPEMLSRLAVQFNQGALLQYQYGEIERAETLCHGQIELFARLSSRSRNRALCLANMVAPYINLARIYGQKGEVTQSLRIFEEVYRFSLQQQDLSIFGHRILVADAPAMFDRSSGLRKVMLSCRVIEVARVLQTVEDYPALIALVEANRDLPEFQDSFFKQYLLEIRTRALLAMEQYQLALDALETCCSQMPLNTTDRIVVHSLLSQIYREWGRHDLAAETVEKLESHLAGVEKFSRKLPILRQVAYRLALERHALGDDVKALAAAEKAFQWCSEWNDQPGSIKSAILLLRICRERRWYGELQKLAATTCFRLDRACAFWELGLASELAQSENESIQMLENSYNLYRSIPFVESRQSCEAVKRSLDGRRNGSAPHSLHENAMVKIDNASIDSVYHGLMEYVPRPL